MFHLLVSYNGWSLHSDSISNSRIYLDRDDEYAKAFLNTDGKINAVKACSIPALLMTEIGGDGSQNAQVVNLTSITQGPYETSIQYVPVPGIMPIPNEMIERHASQLGISRNRLSHTHWEIKEVDLFKFILLNQQKDKPATQVFSTEGINEPSPNLVSIMMPFAAEFNPVFETLKCTIEEVGLNPMRADNFWEHSFVIQDIVNLITRARVVICDLSSKNSNVFYEAGIAHALGKEVILIAQSQDDVPFDLRHIRYIKYLNNSEGLLGLAQAIKSRIQLLIK